MGATVPATLFDLVNTGLSCNSFARHPNVGTRNSLGARALMLLHQALPG